MGRVIGGRRFVEKVLVVEEELKRGGGCRRVERVRREMYDIEKMMEGDLGKEGMKD